MERRVVIVCVTTEGRKGTIYDVEHKSGMKSENIECITKGRTKKDMKDLKKTLCCLTNSLLILP
jgi:hypothetical protein